MVLRKLLHASCDDGTTDDENFGLALGLCTISGVSTIFGAALVLFIKELNYKLLAGALGVSTGVMLYVAFVGLYQEALHEFEDSDDGHTEEYAKHYATIFFFVGMALAFALEVVVHFLDPKAHDHDLRKSIADSQEYYMDGEPTFRVPLVPPVADKDTEDPSNDANDDKHNAHNERLGTTGLVTALTISLHNIPEGIATFIAAVADSGLGVSLVVANILHNVPAGLTVAMPVYYSSKSKVKALGYAAVTGLIFPLSGIIGWQAFGDVSSRTNGILFSLVAGMLVFISLRSLLPTALRSHDSEGFVIICMVIGMVLVAGTLLIFEMEDCDDDDEDDHDHDEPTDPDHSHDPTDPDHSPSSAPPS
eukprot:TRINITY_DN8309_c0_g1::TRINITY_DN8309_c0_g1_i1::g.10233::m.10233 TRINITY_DN8309_c0_g1::TRINITY_DN8309_c0_g1_i1::g.10233  ORF type:complete len:385 (-),score=79.25,sp/A8ZVV7/ZUPT_DESOH/32.48/7e-37,Zip/PF02535.17/4.1e-34,Zip/PF02535.17/1.1e+03,MS_channel/PF00924.13/0.44 TRINITY_DN8309_c0_g1_i1:369-1457(-)